MRNQLVRHRSFFVATSVLAFSAFAGAQQTVAVTSQAMADTQQRLASARNITFTQRAPKQDKSYMKACNGQKTDLSMATEDACFVYEASLHGDGANPNVSIDMYMPLFKACALGGGVNGGCFQLVETLLLDNKPDYAFAVLATGKHVESAYEVTLSSDLTFMQGRFGAFKDSPVYRVVGDRTFLSDFLRSLCLTDAIKATGSASIPGDFTACREIQRLGTTVSQEEVKQAVAQSDQAWQALQEAQDRLRRNSEQRSPGFTSQLGDALTQVQQQQNITIENASAQQQARMQAIQASPQRPTTVVDYPTSSGVGSHTNTSSANIPVQSTNTNSGSSSASTSQQQGLCSDVTNLVSGRAEVKGSEVIGWLTNNSGQDLYVFYTFAVNGVPSTSMANAGGGSSYAGKTSGGEGAGMYTYSADTSPGKIYWYAVPLAQKNANSCVHTW